MSAVLEGRVDDDLWSAIGDPTRRRMLDLLLSSGSRLVGCPQIPEGVDGHHGASHTVPRMVTRTVFGERPEDVGAELATLDFGESTSDEWVRVEGRIGGGGPLMRALLRAEAELLLDEAAAMAASRWTPRAPGKRRVDAFVLVAERLTASLAESGANAAAAGRPGGDP